MSLTTNLTLTPQATSGAAAETEIHVAAGVITVDGVPNDFTDLTDGGQVWPAAPTPFEGPVRREGDVILAIVVVRLDETAADDQPDSPWLIPEASGAIAIPAARKTGLDPGDLSGPDTFPLPLFPEDEA